MDSTKRSADPWADLLYYLDQASCRGSGESDDSVKGRAVFLRAARESAAAAIAAERSRCAAEAQAMIRRYRHADRESPKRDTASVIHACRTLAGIILEGPRRWPACPVCGFDLEVEPCIWCADARGEASR